MKHDLYSNIQEDISYNIFMNSKNIISLSDSFVYYYKRWYGKNGSVLTIYKKEQLRLIFDTNFTLSGIDTRGVIAIKKILGYDHILDYLKNNLSEHEYLNFEKLLFEDV